MRAPVYSIRLHAVVLARAKNALKFLFKAVVVTVSNRDNNKKAYSPAQGGSARTSVGACARDDLLTVVVVEFRARSWNDAQEGTSNTPGGVVSCSASVTNDTRVVTQPKEKATGFGVLVALQESGKKFQVLSPWPLRHCDFNVLPQFRSASRTPVFGSSYLAPGADRREASMLRCSTLEASLTNATALLGLIHGQQ